MRKLYAVFFFALMSLSGMAGDVVTFEQFEVNENGYLNDFGEDACFEAGGFTFNCNYFPEWSYWSGFAISNRTKTAFDSYELDQFNSCVGQGANGSEKYVVAFPQGETIDIDAAGGEVISGFYVTNNAWVVDAILNGDGMTPGAFATGDFLTLSIIGNHPDETADTLVYYLADYRSENEADHYYVSDWRWIDLRALGQVESITFRMDSSRKNDWGMTTPGYFCMDDFNGEAPSAATFEEIALQPESAYNGAGVEGETVTDIYGSQVTKSKFVSGGYQFTTLYNAAWGSWSGFAVSNETATVYATYADQYRSCVGHGHDGSSNYAVVFPSAMGEAVEPVDGPKTINGMYVTNSAWNVNAYTVGGGMTPGAFTTGDWCKLTITGTHADESTATMDVYLADYRSENAAEHYYIDQWQWIDLSGLGEVKSLTFAISSSRNNEWGMTTPGYFCIDDFDGQADGTLDIHPSASAGFTAANEAQRFTIDGKRINARQRGVNLIRMSDGTVRKVMVR